LASSQFQSTVLWRLLHLLRQLTSKSRTRPRLIHPSIYIAIYMAQEAIYLERYSSYSKQLQASSDRLERRCIGVCVDVEPRQLSCSNRKPSRRLLTTLSETPAKPAFLINAVHETGFNIPALAHLPKFMDATSPSTKPFWFLAGIVRCTACAVLLRRAGY
jgi:hypothetical protein